MRVISEIWIRTWRRLESIRSFTGAALRTSTWQVWSPREATVRIPTTIPPVGDRASAWLTTFSGITTPPFAEVTEFITCVKTWVPRINFRFRDHFCPSRLVADRLDVCRLSFRQTQHASPRAGIPMRCPQRGHCPLRLYLASEHFKDL